MFHSFYFFGGGGLLLLGYSCCCAYCSPVAQPLDSVFSLPSVAQSLLPNQANHPQKVQ